MLAEGVYGGKIAEWGFGESFKKGSPYFYLIAELTHQEVNGDLEELESPVRRTVQMYLTGGALPITAANIRSLGYVEQTLEKLDPTHPEAFPLKGREVFVDVRHEEYNDRQKEKIQLRRQSNNLKLKEYGGLGSLNALWQEEAEKAKKKASGEKEPDPYDKATPNQNKKGGRKKKKGPALGDENPGYSPADYPATEGADCCPA